MVEIKNRTPHSILEPIGQEDWITEHMNEFAENEYGVADFDHLTEVEKEEVFEKLEEAYRTRVNEDYE